MSKRTTHYSMEERIKAVTLVLNDGYSIHQASKEEKVPQVTLRDLLRKYKAHIIESLKKSRK